MIPKRFFVLLILLASAGMVCAQGIMRKTYHDKDRKNIKEIYFVTDTISNTLEGKYISYYLNGLMESKGQFVKNETAGVWEFFYESGGLKMRGILKQNSNYGLWEYFYESGEKSMEGTINGRNREGKWTFYYENGQIKETGEFVQNKREGLWLSYFEDGVRKGEVVYANDFGRYTEYYHTGKVLSEGPRMGTRQVGHWRFYSENGTLAMEGDFENNRRAGEWITYYPSGTPASKGRYENDKPTGHWEYFFDNGKVSSSGEFLGGQRSGYWSAYDPSGNKISEVTYQDGTGEYREYYSSGKLKAKGLQVNNNRVGKWQFFYEDGKLEGDCEYTDGRGTYSGYYPDGSLQTKGEMQNDKRIGMWEIYKHDGTLSGYYRPIYDDQKLSREINELAELRVAASSSPRKTGFTYFDVRSNEFRGIIIAGNPLLTFAGRLPFGVEFYSQERLGHEFEFIGIRDPFFQADDKIAPGKLFQRGYSITIKQKFYNPIRAGMWYFGHEIRFTNKGHFANVTVSPGGVVTVSASEQRFQYGLLFGYRLMQKNNASGFTIDLFSSVNVGYRSFDEEEQYSSYFKEMNRSHLVTSLHVGLNIGHIFSAR
jgi:antitoxin component YwqK of YwqJK toxin-antitoxin module